MLDGSMSDMKIEIAMRLIRIAKKIARVGMSPFPHSKFDAVDLS